MIVGMWESFLYNKSNGRPYQNGFTAKEGMVMRYSFCEMGIMIAVVSFLGFAVENTWLAVTKGYVDNRNMNLPFLLGYGLALAAIYYGLGIPSETPLFSLLPGRARLLLYFLAVMLCVSVGEIVLGRVTERLCGIEYWNYSWIPLHITKYTSVPTSVGFAAMITLFMEHCFQPLMTAISRMDGRAVRVAAPVLLVLLATDYLYCYGQMMKRHSFYEKWKMPVQWKGLRRHSI